jgi:hypothetical protein
LPDSSAVFRSLALASAKERIPLPAPPWPGALTKLKNQTTKMKTLFIALTLGTLAFAGISRADDKAPVKPYQLQTCLVSGEKLGEMGDPVVAVYEGQEIKFCCASCKKKVDADPAKYLKKYQDAVKAAKPAGN